jgi:uncharacterized membrane protein YgcG
VSVSAAHTRPAVPAAVEPTLVDDRQAHTAGEHDPLPTTATAATARIKPPAPSSQQVAAPPAGAQPPLRLSSYITDNAGVLSESGRTAVTSATDKLYADRQIRLWVVYVDNFAGQSAANWAQRTFRMSDLGNDDAILAAATNQRAYAFLIPSTVQGVTQSQVDNLRLNQIEPALRKGDWSGAAVAAADGLDSAAG